MLPLKDRTEQGTKKEITTGIFSLSRGMTETMAITDWSNLFLKEIPKLADENDTVTTTGATIKKAVTHYTMLGSGRTVHNSENILTLAGYVGTF